MTESTEHKSPSGGPRGGRDPVGGRLSGDSSLRREDQEDVQEAQWGGEGGQGGAGTGQWL